MTLYLQDKQNLQGPAQVSDEPVKTATYPDGYILLSLRLDDSACSRAEGVLRTWEQRYGNLYWQRFTSGQPFEAQGILHAGINPSLSATAFNALVSALTPLSTPGSVLWEYVPASAPPPPTVISVWRLDDHLLITYCSGDGLVRMFDLDVNAQGSQPRLLTHVSQPHPQPQNLTLHYTERPDGDHRTFSLHVPHPARLAWFVGGAWRESGAGTKGKKGLPGRQAEA